MKAFHKSYDELTVYFLLSRQQLIKLLKQSVRLVFFQRLFQRFTDKDSKIVM